MDEIIESRCCICGTVKNCGKYLERVLKNIEIIGALFSSFKIIISYDVSSDNSLEILQKYQQLHPLQMVLHVNAEPLHEYRVYNIAKARNKCLDTIRQEFSTYEYFIMMDCDDKCSYNINLGIFNNYLINNNNTWDSLSFNHPEGYYDLWALSKRPYVVSCHNIKNINDMSLHIEEIIKKTSKNDLIQCFSAFNGFAIYKTNKFINCCYDGTFRLDYIPKKLLIENIKAAGKINLSNNNEDCEHRHFHFQAVFKNNAKIMISPLCLFFK